MLFILHHYYRYRPVTARPQHSIIPKHQTILKMSSTRTIALITGANRGIGRAVALALARDHNHTVILACRDHEAAKSTASELTAELKDSPNSKATGNNFIPLHLVLESDDSITAAKTFIEAEFNGQLNVLINNAGILIDNFYHRDDYTLTPRELFSQTFDTNVIGPAVLTETLLPLLKKSSSPATPSRIVFTTSTMGSLKLSLDETTAWHTNEATAYDASKAAVNMLAINYSRRMKDVGGKVNAACPGLVATRLTGGYGSSTEDGAVQIVRMATLGGDGVTGTFSRSDAEVPW